MGFSYDSNLETTKDRLRFLVQDTTDAGHFLEDEEIGFIAGEETNLYRAAAVLCRTIAAKINKLPGFKDRQQFDPEEKAKNYLKLAENFDKKAEQSIGTNLSANALAGNLTGTSGKGSCPAFKRGLHLDHI
jgi:hypothetical protein